MLDLCFLVGLAAAGRVDMAATMTNLIALESQLDLVLERDGPTDHCTGDGPTKHACIIDVTKQEFGKAEMDWFLAKEMYMFGGTGTYKNESNAAAMQILVTLRTEYLESLLEGKIFDEAGKARMVPIVPRFFDQHDFLENVVQRLEIIPTVDGTPTWSDRSHSPAEFQTMLEDKCGKQDLEKDGDDEETTEGNGDGPRCTAHEATPREALAAVLAAIDCKIIALGSVTYLSDLDFTVICSPKNGATEPVLLQTAAEAEAVVAQMLTEAVLEDFKGEATDDEPEGVFFHPGRLFDTNFYTDTFSKMAKLNLGSPSARRSIWSAVFAMLRGFHSLNSFYVSKDVSSGKVDSFTRRVELKVGLDPSELANPGGDAEDAPEPEPASCNAQCESEAFLMPVKAGQTMSLAKDWEAMKGQMEIAFGFAGLNDAEKKKEKVTMSNVVSTLVDTKYGGDGTMSPSEVTKTRVGIYFDALKQGFTVLETIMSRKTTEGLKQLDRVVCDVTDLLTTPEDQQTTCQKKETQKFEVSKESFFMNLMRALVYANEAYWVQGAIDDVVFGMDVSQGTKAAESIMMNLGYAGEHLVAELLSSTHWKVVAAPQAAKAVQAEFDADRITEEQKNAMGRKAGEDILKTVSTIRGDGVLKLAKYMKRVFKTLEKTPESVRNALGMNVDPSKNTLTDADDIEVMRVLKEIANDVMTAKANAGMKERGMSLPVTDEDTSTGTCEQDDTGSSDPVDGKCGAIALALPNAYRQAALTYIKQAGGLKQLCAKVMRAIQLITNVLLASWFKTLKPKDY